MALTFEHFDEETNGRLRRAFPGFTDGFVRSKLMDLFMPSSFQRYYLDFANFQLRSEDTWIISFPKSGTTWTQEMVWLIANDCDFKRAQCPLRQRVPFLEDLSLWPDAAWAQFNEKIKDSNQDVNDSFREDFISTLPSPRFIKTHLPLSYLPASLLQTCKVVYVARNPKDVVVSWYYHHLMDPIMETTLKFNEFVEYFMRDEVTYSPYWGPVLEAWNKRHHPNFLFLFYEDMKMDLPGQIRKVGEFLGKNLTDDQVAALTEHLSFDQFKKNPWVNADDLKDLGYFKKEGEFIRKGQIGDWKNHFDDDLKIRFDQWIEQHLEGNDLRFPNV